MNVDRILSAFNAAGADYILFGGMNFLLRHVPELTFDVDLWVEDSAANLERVNAALRALGAEWGKTEAAWKPVPETSAWLKEQVVFCLTTREGAVDIFRDVRGLEGLYAECRARAVQARTAGAISFPSLSDGDMLACQLALDEKDRKHNRIEVLKKALGSL